MINRRDFIATTSRALLAPSLMGLVACQRSFGSGQLRRTAHYGPLEPSVHCPELLIPRGFRCYKLSQTLAPSQADASFIVPQGLDGMAAFATADGNVRLIRNHEIGDPADIAQPLGGAWPAYDARGGGGTTTLDVRISHDGEPRVELLREFVSLSGTVVNCAGGPTPWGSWLSCEENTSGPPHGRGQRHGYVFEVPASAQRPVDPVPLKALGRFVHEAVAIDPATGFIYETEDIRYNPANASEIGAGFYRFIPNQPGDLRAGGQLQALAVRGQPNYLTAHGQTVGRRLRVQWVDIGDADPAAADHDRSAVFRQALAAGAAIFDRLEGCWYGDNSIYFDATEGGDANLGQIWRYIPDGDAADQLADDAAGELVLIFESPDRALLANPDNICISPRGGLVICEDTGGVQHVRGLSPDGEIFPLVRTAAPAPEFCGACFSPGGDVLFFNIQGSTRTRSDRLGATYALMGPWEDGVL